VLDFMLAEISDLLENLVVYPDRMLANLNLTGGLVYSQRVLLALVDGGIDRQVAYKLVQKHALSAWDEGGASFRDRLLSDPEITRILDASALDALLDHEDQLVHVDAIFERLGLLHPSNLGA
jgi:adenylosuccinate lyase